MELEDSPPSPAMYDSMDSKDLGFIFFPSLSREFLGVSCPTYLLTYLLCYLFHGCPGSIAILLFFCYTTYFPS